MADRDHVLEGFGPSPFLLTAHDIGNGQPGPEGPVWYLSSLLEDDAAWGQPRPPLRRPFTVRTDLAIDQPPSTAEKTPRGRGPSDGAPPSQRPPPQASPAPAEGHRSPGSAGWGQKGHSPPYSPQQLWGPPPSMARGARVSGGPDPSGPRFYVPFSPGPGFFVPRAPLRGPAGSPSGRLGGRMEAPPEPWRRGGPHGKVGTYFFPTVRPEVLQKNWRRPVTFPPGAPASPVPTAISPMRFQPQPSSPFPCCQLPFP
uniref:Uncharacterized protein n=1 Tax=Myotis lucifugus TaxID=59463 RepID=G1Q8P6_MYOLU